MSKYLLLWTILFCLKKTGANFSYEIRSGVLRRALEELPSYEASYFNLDSETPGSPISISSLVFANRKNLILCLLRARFIGINNPYVMLSL